MEFKLANCACVSGWSNLAHSHGILLLSCLVGESSVVRILWLICVATFTYYIIYDVELSLVLHYVFELLYEHIVRFIHASCWQSSWNNTASSYWLRSNKKDFVHCETEVHTMWHRLLKSWQRHKLQHISSYFACLYQLCTEYQASKYFKYFGLKFCC